LIDVIDDSESTEFAGKVIAALSGDKNLMKYTAKVVNAAEYARAHNIRDIDNRSIANYRQLNSAMKLILPKNLHFMANFVPDFIKVPQFVMDLKTSKF
jgi:hypothetical protein